MTTRSSSYAQIHEFGYHGEPDGPNAWIGSVKATVTLPFCSSHSARERAIATLLGDVSESDRLRQAAERFTDALTDPILGFELDELETFFSKKK